MSRQRRLGHRWERRNAPSLDWCADRQSESGPDQENVAIDAGWGKLIFAHTFSDNSELARCICDEEPERRNISMYIREPHVVLSQAPQELFLDPSHTFRLYLSELRPTISSGNGYRIRRLYRRRDIKDVNRILKSRRMVPFSEEALAAQKGSKAFSYFVAEDPASGDLLGVVMGVDHVHAFGDPERGSSLWCLAVDPSCSQPGIGRALVAQVAGHYAARGRAFLDLSVMHDNEEAIALYEDMGFKRVPVFCVKKKNSINESLYIAPAPDETMNPYAEIIIEEARRRGIAVEVLDAELAYFKLSLGGRSIVCRESLSELTSAIAMSRCDDKRVTHRLLSGAGLRVPAQCVAASSDANHRFLEECGAVVVKPARGEQGQGVSVNIRNAQSLDRAIETARRYSDTVIIEQFVTGEDLRIIVIDYQVVAAAVRRPPQITANGRDTIRRLIQKQSRRRASSTGGESRIPLDDATEECVRSQGYALDDVADAGEVLQVRENANLHTGGTIHDVTEDLHPELRRAAVLAAKTLEIPVTGLDFMVSEPDQPDYWIIEANERPGLANHEPAPTAQRFIDFLFPRTAAHRQPGKQ